MGFQSAQQIPIKQGTRHDNDHYFAFDVKPIDKIVKKYHPIRTTNTNPTTDNRLPPANCGTLCFGVGTCQLTYY